MILALVAAAAVLAQTPYVAPDGRTVDQLIAAHVLPDPAITPGVFNPAVTPATLQQTICVDHWTSTVRLPTSYTDKLRAHDTPAGHKPSEGELDHLVSIEDGGAPADPRNLWWMIYSDHYGARVKDVLETHVARAICAGTLTLDQARDALTPNWLVGYARYIGPLPK